MRVFCECLDLVIQSENEQDIYWLNQWAAAFPRVTVGAAGLHILVYLTEDAGRDPKSTGEMTLEEYQNECEDQEVELDIEKVEIKRMNYFVETEEYKKVEEAYEKFLKMFHGKSSKELK